MTYILMLVVAACLAVLERIGSIRFKRSFLIRPFFWSDAWYLFTGYLVPGAATIAFIQAVSALLGALGIPRLSDLYPPLWIGTVGALVLLDLGNYTAHWLMHRHDVLWEFHKAHHSSETLDWMATFRSHAVEQALRRVVAPLGLILLGLPSDAVALANAILNSWAMFIHSNLDVHIPALEALFVTPRLHRLHHVPLTAHSNFGTLFTIWDRALRDRFVVADTGPEVALGVPGEVGAYPQGWLAQFVEPFRRVKIGAGLWQETRETPIAKSDLSSVIRHFDGDEEPLR